MDEVGGKLEEALFEIRRVIAGQEEMLERVLVCLLSGGHLLIEGVPGPREDADDQDRPPRCSAARSSACSSRPTSCRPTSSARAIYRPDKSEFETELGPVFCNFLLADEINRAPGQGAVGAARGDAGAPGHDRAQHASRSPSRSSCSRRRTRSSRRARTRCPRRRSTASC